MFRNYVTIALRHVARSKSYSAINIFGLSLGISCCLLLALYVEDELGFDVHHDRVDDLYRITTHFDVPRHGFDKIATVSPPIAHALRNNIPEVETAARLFPQGTSLFTFKDRSFYEADGYVADSTIFKILTYEFLEGDPATALSHANTVVISKTLARKLFGIEPALNKLITISQDTADISFSVSGVLSDDVKSHLRASYFISIASDGPAKFFRSEQVNNEWAGMQFVMSYVKLFPGHHKDAVIKKANNVLITYGADDMKALGFTKKLGLEPVKEIYVKSDIQQSSRINYLYTIASIAAFILLIACINFMNLSTARAAKRASEFGIRKVMGAYRSSLIGQIMGEAVVNVAISIVVSLIVVRLCLPIFNDFSGKNISLGNENFMFIALAILLITIFAAFASGSYPAFYFSAFQPAEVLKGKLKIGSASAWFRKSLVVFQFVITILLICGVFVVAKQTKYMQQKSLGFDSQAKIVLPLRTQTAKTNYKTLQNELRKNGSVKELSAADYMPGSTIIRDMPFYIAGENIESAVPHKRNIVDYRYQELLGIKLIAGRGFTDNRKLESQNKVILNRTSVERLGLSVNTAVGQKIYCEWQGQKHELEVIGVMEDYHQTSLKEQILPTLFEMPATETEYDFLIASVDTENFNATIADLETIWKRLVDDTPFEYSLLAETVQRQYDDDRKVSHIMTFFTIVATFISCLGLYGLSSYMAERRTKEIGVRKVLGARVDQIVKMMSAEFIKLVIVASLISMPLAWYLMTQWLERFAYQVSIDVLLFVYAGAAALVVALITVSFESIKAATANPANSLKNE